MRYIDPIHGVMDLPNIIFEIINTEFFQRLRNLKQLGACSYVFPGATHNRFEHCIGVCHLIDKFLDILEKNSAIKVTDYHRKCVMIAGLLHDVGHGPFSHMWDQFVHQRRYKDWNHETSSCDITRHIFDKNDIKLSTDMQEHVNGIEIIVSMINGDVDCLQKYLSNDQMYLSEIVNNKFCFIDVDKWDYILRDSYYLNNVISLPKGFARIFSGARVTATADGVTHISYHIDDYHLVHELFENRANLHGRCYQHPEIIGIEHLLVKAFLSAEENGFLFQGVKLSEAHMHPDVYRYLDDSIIQIITISNDERLKEAQDFLGRVRTRNLYPIVGMSSSGYEIPVKNGLSKEFILKTRNIPTASETMPKNLILHNSNGDITDKPGELHPKYILYYTNGVTPAVLQEVKQFQK
ncbi:deoxynucleoside triphosphate triphosphohydrolase SAMHD1 [Bradysia coprophila]|uniref:deoxynucleoside triphosphate triphosphohydrolase SAMHD1 n=1 Tax=Bradysia coprophila TaxID=38358 RepID=UPI00187DB4CA|nr:deoxynucleoside triphosphate triphosphohydrolase SAMHD1 [Bradysia coprophila]XP_037040567.1 deoxynucleoside triphosphate triphosphohydrolase SAMHD1 [Bradysia coprophila]XP_037040568.1 deoxynucleoside triphosphate triphosphohydrolase SAMHD1 [Bradysia coprophila]